MDQIKQFVLIVILQFRILMVKRQAISCKNEALSSNPEVANLSQAKIREDPDNTFFEIL